ncbi:helix-turn-helix domain-containing protein [Streptantibioticus parmotrematis]|uniref:helix-turn-helix domain-containing protein n=1 Tax=Streptantibioticus parmotrematis TaxID=2873249 RepID=UPI003404CAEB
MGADIGRRLCEVRKRRGMTQRELASAAGVSVSLIRKLEQGDRATVRLETARRLAVALGVPTTSLLAAAVDDGTPSADGTWAAVREALRAPADRAAQEAPTVGGVRDALAAAEPLFSGDQLRQLSLVLPALIRDADTVAGLDDEGRALRARVMQLTGWLLTQTRQFDAADEALGRALDDAPDPSRAAVTVSTRCWLLLRTGRIDEAGRLAERWADEIEPRVSRATKGELSAWGWLLLRTSAAAVRDNRPDDADDAMRLAHSAAVAMGCEAAPGGDFLQAFGPLTVVLKRAENAMVTDRPDLVLSMAAKIRPSEMRPTSNNRNRHLLDVANAQVAMRRYGEAVDILEGIRHAAPEWLANQRYAQDVLRRIVTRRRTLTSEMRTLADAVGLPL